MDKKRFEIDPKKRFSSRISLKKGDLVKISIWKENNDKNGRFRKIPEIGCRII